MLTRDQIMQFYRSEAFDLAGLTPDDRIEIFLGILAGQDDITVPLLEELCETYDTTLQNLFDDAGAQPPAPFDDLNTKNYTKVFRAKEAYITKRGWGFGFVIGGSWGVKGLAVAKHTDKNLRFERASHEDAVQAAYNYEVLS